MPSSAHTLLIHRRPAGLTGRCAHERTVPLFDADRLSQVSVSRHLHDREGIIPSGPFSRSAFLKTRPSGWRRINFLKYRISHDAVNPLLCPYKIPSCASAVEIAADRHHHMMTLLILRKYPGTECIRGYRAGFRRFPCAAAGGE